VNVGHIQLTTWMATPCQLSANNHLSPHTQGIYSIRNQETPKSEKKNSLGITNVPQFI